MKKLFKKILFILIVFIWSSLILAQDDILPVSQIKPGMTGYGKTVFQGTAIEKFDVEIISVLKNIRPEGDLILARLSGKTVDKAGIIAGMSGSPVYIQDKIIGALAFSWSFSKEPIAAITPIEDMLEIIERKYNTNFYNIHHPFKEYYVKDNKDNLQVLKIPLAFQGITEAGFDIFKEQFKNMGFFPMAGGEAGKDIQVPDKFEPGSAVAVNLITGDLNLSAIGTVTYVKQNKILIFGHPMFFSGSTDLPMSHAYIHTVLPSLYQSFKIGSATKTVGKIFQDQLGGLAGVMDQKAGLIPFQLDVNYQGVLKQYNFGLIKTYHMLPSLLSLCLYRSIEKAGGWWENNTLDFEFTVQFDNKSSMVLKDTIPGINLLDSLQTGMLLFLKPISEILMNKFEKVSITSIKGELKINTRIKMLEIQKMICDQREYYPGETVKARIVLKEYQGNTRSKDIEFKIPYNTPEGKFPLIVSSGREAQYVDFLLSPSKYMPYSFAHFLEIINTLSKTTELAIWSMSKDKGLMVNGEKLERIPDSYFSMLKNSLESGAMPVFTLLKEDLTLPYVIIGNTSQMIDIKKRSIQRKK
ncbi:MAG: hypothetical protein JW827_00195 [Spirochaetes bacterium]|nr:hypothetical protein [Spirochaetota bacterium]